jgi:hypothetical protein
VIPSPTTDNVLTSIRSFLVAALPSDVSVVAGQPNRIPEVASPRFVVMSPPRFERIETNTDTYADAKFTGSISGTTLTITAVDPKFPNGQISIGSTIFGAGVAAGTTVTAILTGTGQIGTYAVNNSQTVASETISAGAKSITMPAKATVQLDFHSADDTSGDLANVISTLMRDSFAVDQFANQSPNYGTVPLYADDARQLPFFNDQQQVEWRWVVEALIQCNVVVSVPQQFADLVGLVATSVDTITPIVGGGLVTDLTNPSNEVVVPLILTGV